MYIEYGARMLQASSSERGREPQALAQLLFHSDEGYQNELAV